jgi:protein ImuB
MSTEASRLWAGLYCPELPLAAVWRLAPEQGPVAVHGLERGQARILQASSDALEAGVRPGQSLANALAILPRLQSRPRHLAGEVAALEQMAISAYGYSHQLVLAPPDSVLLEVGGSRRLHGGQLKPLLEALGAQLAEQGLAVRIGLAPVPAAARLLARNGQIARSRRELRERIGQLPLKALELSEEQSRALLGCGLRRTGELLALPAAERARRFGPALEQRLAEWLGRRETPLAAWQPPEHFSLRLELPVASDHSQALLFVCRRMLVQLGQWLEIRDQAMTRLKVALEREDQGPALRFEIALARPGFDLDRLLELTGLKLEPLRLPAPISAIRFKADSTTEHRPPQADLFSGGNRGDAWPALLDRLAARLGQDNIAGLNPRPDHRPEHAWAWVEPGTRPASQDPRPRPAWLLPEPRACRREQMRLCEGPERIESGWWDGRDCCRDYWTAIDRHGRRLWIFREHRPRQGWFIHGVFE